MESFLTSLLQQIQGLGPSAYAAIFLIAFLESFIFLGIVIPGTLIMVFLGFIASQDALEFLPLVAVTFLGACIGDLASYYIGSKKGDWAVAILSRFSSKTDYVKIGEDFFSRHGNKSIFLGRFIALIRPFIPFVAGMFKMSWRSFIFWNVLSALAWSLLYVSIGYFFGYAWRSAAAWVSRGSLLLLIAAAFFIVTHFIRKRVTKPPKNRE